MEFKATNNITEYEGLILGLNKAKALGARTVLVKIDSQVIARQVELHGTRTRTSQIPSHSKGS